MKLSVFTLSFLLILSFGVQAQKNTKITTKLNSHIQSKNKSEQTSVWIFFADKGDNISDKLIEAENKLPANSVKRRKKLYPNKILQATFYDIPVKIEYLNQIKSNIVKQRHISRWLNAVSAEVTTDNINQLASLDCIKKIDLVRKGSINKNSEFDFYTQSKRLTQITCAA